MSSTTPAISDRAEPQSPAPSRPVSFSRGDPGFSLFELGFSALADAEQLRASVTTRFTALLLYRNAVILLLNAHHARSGGLSSTVPAAERITHLEILPSATAALGEVSSRELALLRKHLGSDSDEAELAALSVEDRERCLSAFRRLAMALAEPLAVEAGHLRRALVRRWSKLAAVASCLLILAGWALLRQPNLALGRAVVVDSRDPQYGVDPSQVLDGQRTNLGFHTTEGERKSVTIDLGSLQSIHRVDVFNRVDCCLERAVPLTLEVSRDGKAFRRILVRLDPFALWKAEFPRTTARYVRLVQQQNAPFHLAEIEVY